MKNPLEIYEINTVLTCRPNTASKNLLISNMKDNISPEKKSGIYQINCKDCEKRKENEIWKIGLKNT
jgi:hypothetical protein